MQNKHTISFYHPKACQPETSATRFSPTQRSRTHTHSHTKRVPITFTKNRGVVMSTPPLIYYSYHSYTLRTCIVAGRGILGCFECVVKEDSFGLFGGLGRGSWQERKEGAGRGSWARELGEGARTDAGAGGGRGSRRWPGEQEVAGGLPARRWERRGKRGDGAGSGGRAKGEGVQPERAEQRGASEGRRQPPGRGAGLWSTAARGLEPF